MKRLLDYNPLTGESVTFDYGADDRLVITHSQKIDRKIDTNKALANDDDYTKQGIKNDMWHYATIPNIYIVELQQKHGVSLTRMEDRPKLFKLLNTEYKFLKTTHKTHTVK